MIPLPPLTVFIKTIPPLDNFFKLILCPGRFFHTGQRLLVQNPFQLLLWSWFLRVQVNRMLVLLNGILFVSDWISGAFVPSTVKLSLVSVPILALALCLGNRIAKRIDRRAFLVLTYILMLVSGVSLLVK